MVQKSAYASKYVADYADYDDQKHSMNLLGYAKVSGTKLIIFD